MRQLIPDYEGPLVPRDPPDSMFWNKFLKEAWHARAITGAPAECFLVPTLSNRSHEQANAEFASTRPAGNFRSRATVSGVSSVVPDADVEDVDKNNLPIRRPAPRIDVPERVLDAAVALGSRGFDQAQSG